MGAVFLSCNRNKRSVVLDLTTDDGRRTLKALTDHADVFVTNMRPDALAKCGADADTLRADHPELVHCTVRGFGSDGPYADLPAYDDIAQAVSGLAAQQEWMAGEPQYVASAVGDKVSGLTAALAIAAALHGRAVTGEGADDRGADGRDAHGVRARRAPLGSHLRAAAWRSALSADVVAVPPSVSHGRRLHLGRRVQRPELGAILRARSAFRISPTKPRFGSLSARTENLDELYTLVGDHMTNGTTAEWFERLREAGIPPAPYNRVDDLFDDPHLAAIGFWEEYDHPTEGPTLQYVTPIRFDGERRSGPLRLAPTPPMLGELDTADALERVARADRRSIGARCESSSSHWSIGAIVVADHRRVADEAVERGDPRARRRRARRAAARARRGRDGGPTRPARGCRRRGRRSPPAGAIAATYSNCSRNVASSARAKRNDG